MIKVNEAGQNVDGINDLFDEVLVTKSLRNDAQLSYLMRVAPPVISKMRHGHLMLGDSMVLKLHEICGLEVKHVREKLEVAK